MLENNYRAINATLQLLGAVQRTKQTRLYLVTCMKSDSFNVK